MSALETTATPKARANRTARKAAFRLSLPPVPFRGKLRVIILATCTVALCVASTALYALQFFFFKRDYRQDLGALAEIIATSSAGPIVLGSPQAAQEILSALKSKP